MGLPCNEKEVDPIQGCLAKPCRPRARVFVMRCLGWLMLPWVTLAWAQGEVAPGSTASARVEVSAPRSVAEVAGFGHLPLSGIPMQVDTTTAEQMKDLGIQRLSDMSRIDASVGDGFNTAGYWDFLSVRGFVLDNSLNYRRDGLPIEAKTSIPLDNKSAIEVLKGISGMQAGISSPGGLVNLLVKRPTDTAQREVFIGWQQNGSVLASTDLGDRFGEQRAFGVRFNAAYESIDPQVRVASGDRYLLALALDWRAGTDTLLEAEIETSHRSQPFVPGFSVLGSMVPAPSDPNINLNNQSWSQASVYDATTGSLRWTQRLNAQWQWVAQAASQQLGGDERAAYPLTCFAEMRFDRFCSDGTYDMYDYRSENQKRSVQVLDLGLNAGLKSGSVSHALSFGVQFSDAQTTQQRQAFNYAGTGNVEGTLVVPPAPARVQESTNPSQRSSEAYLRDAIAFDDRNTLWAGLRSTRQSFSSVRTDGSQATASDQSYTSPWLAWSHRLVNGTMLYASWGIGYEPDLVPNLPRYTNRGQALEALRSQQFELGAKGRWGTGQWTAAAFDIDRPVSGDVGSCGLPDSCERVRDGSQRHRGIEAGLNGRVGNWGLGGGAMALQARREGSADARLNGLRPPNVPELAIKLQLGYRVPGLPGLELSANGLYEGNRMVTPDNSLSIPSVSQFDLGLRYEQRVGGAAWVWRAGVSNLTNRSAWRSSPFEYGHLYLFPQAARSFALSLQAKL